MSSFVTYNRDFSHTLSTTQKVGRFIFIACAMTLGAGTAIADTESSKAVYENRIIVDRAQKNESIVSSTGLRFLIDKNNNLPKFNLEFVDKQIAKFMNSLRNNEEMFYEDDLVVFAEQVIADNPGAFKNFM